MDKNLYSTFQAAKILGVTPDTVLKWIKFGRIPASRTLGGHYRIHKDKIYELLSERELQGPAFGEPPSRKAFKYCWEFNSKDGEVQDDCRNCLVYKTRARRCYEMSPVSKELGHMKLFCDAVCEDCDYYRHVKDQAISILVITDDDGFLEDIDDNGKIFNFRTTNNEYECSAIVEKMRPDFAVIDCSFPKSRDFLNYLTNDTRIPYIKIILVSETEITADYCNKKIIGRSSKPLTAGQIEEFVTDLSA